MKFFLNTFGSFMGELKLHELPDYEFTNDVKDISLENLTLRINSPIIIPWEYIYKPKERKSGYECFNNLYLYIEDEEEGILGMYSQMNDIHYTAVDIWHKSRCKYPDLDKGYVLKFLNISLKGKLYSLQRDERPIEDFLQKFEDLRNKLLDKPLK